MATLGFADLRETAAPSLWDTAEILKARLADGSSIEAMVGDLQAGLRMLNGSLLSMPHYSALFAVQDDPEVEYPIGVSNGFEEASEYGTPSPARGATTGHMLPLIAYDRALGWTMRYLRKARRNKLDADVRSVVVDARAIWQQKLLTRFFSTSGNTVGTTANADVPLADAAATDSTYVPPDSPEGESFDTSHTHFLRHAAISDANLNITAEHLQEHGHQSPFDIIASRTDASSWAGLTGYKAPEWPGIVYHSSAVERASVGEISSYFGYVEMEYGIGRIWLTPRVPTNYYGMYKGYGPGDTRNPLRVRIDRNVGFGFTLVDGNWVNLPTHLAVVYTEFGVGIGEDRVNGVCVEIDSSGSYASPTIS
jgi:hypothetical protein